MTDISATNKEYAFYYPTWVMIRNLIKGERALKQHDYNMMRTQVNIKAGDYVGAEMPYIPMPNPEDSSNENMLRYATYIERASLFNFTKRTEQGMGGMVFLKEPVIELPAKLEYVEDDVDGTGIGIDQQAREVLEDILETGNEGLLVDFPPTDTATSIGQAEAMGIRASIIIYKAESILDWRCDKVGAAQRLVFVKLKEIKETVSDTDIFAMKCEPQYRVLLLKDGEYLQQVYDEKGFQVGQDIIPKDANNASFDYIPFFFVGSTNNRPGLDSIPLSEIAELNIKHYRNSADWEESSYMVGQPTPVFTGLSEQWIKNVLKGSVQLGSRSAVSLPEGGGALLLQASPNTMPETGMKHKEEQAIALGARLITSGGQAETAEAVMIKHSSDASVLKTIVQNINHAYELALEAAAQFMGAENEEIEFKLNTEFITERLQGDQITALVSAWQMGAISKPVLDSKLVKGGVIDESTDLEKMNNEIENEPKGPNLGDA